GALGRGDLTRSDGRFNLAGVPAGTYTMELQRIGYAAAEEQIEVRPGATTNVTVEMHAAALDVAGIIVTSGGRAQRNDEVFQPASSLGGVELRQRLATSVATTLANEPGIS